MLGAIPATVRSIRLGRRWLPTPDELPHQGLTPCDAGTLGVDPEHVAAAIALLASGPDPRPLLVEPAGIRLVSDSEAAR